MENRELSQRHGTTSPSVSFLPNPLPGRALLLSSGVALVAVVIGFLLLDPSPEGDSIISSDSAASDPAAESSESLDPGARAISGHSKLDGMDADELRSDRHAKSIERGDKLMAEMREQLVANPLPGREADASSVDFDAEVRTIRAEIRNLRNKLNNSNQ